MISIKFKNQRKPSVLLTKVFEIQKIENFLSVQISRGEI